MRTIILTIPKHDYRITRMKAAMQVYSYPIKDKVFFWRAPDVEHYGERPTLAANLVLHAISDGFPFFKHIIYDEKKNRPRERCESNVHIIAQHWSFCQIYRRIIEMDKVCLVCHDDVLPRATYQEINDKLNKLKAEKGNFKLWQYQWFKRPDKDMHLPDITEPTPVSGVRRGLAGRGDKINIISPEGAKWMLALSEEYIRKTHRAGAEDFFEIPLHKGINPEGIYSTEHREDSLQGVNYEKYITQLSTPTEDSNLMYYDKPPKFKWKIPIEDTETIPDIDWHYYENVLPKLKKHYELFDDPL